MAAPSRKPKTPERQRRQPPRRGLRSLFGGPSFFGNLITTVLIFLLLMSVYSVIASAIQPSNSIPVSEVAADVASGKVKAITVNGDSLDLTYQDGTTKTSRKDSASGLPETLATYGVTPS
ncbi:MAG TPA: ATP-dependent metallopeptidase FtsH/Yme1/Tma family protein, partial [Candidatus Paceibacterota bacterium]|nr:ATP-dependent metallopeptidase FtsH/Yme1/Tma family protein [Candidatus Paceibacterota bacterium]